MSAHLCCQPPRIILAGISVWLSAAQVTRRDLSQNDGWRQPETVSHVAEQFPWVSSPCYSPPRCPMPRKPVSLSPRVSLDTSLLNVRSPLSGPPSFNRLTRHTHFALPLLPSPSRDRKVEVEMLLGTLKHQTTD